MAQNNLTVQNGTGLQVRTGFNGAIESLATHFAGSTDPATMNPSCAFPHMIWADTANNLLKQRTSDNTAWVTIGVINTDGTFALNSNALADVVTTATANKILKLDANGKLPASITGDAATVGGKTPGTGANNVLVLDASGKVPQENLPPTHIGDQLSLQQNGYFKMANGLIIQWGSISITVGTNVTITFPIAFPQICYSLASTQNMVPGSGFIMRTLNITKTKFDVMWDYYATTGSGMGAVCNYIAIGS